MVFIQSYLVYLELWFYITTKAMDEIGKFVLSRLAQYAMSILGGLIIAIDTAIVLFIPCFIITLLDVWSAYCLGRRVHKKYPDKSDGKFKSEYKYKILYTMIIIFTALILGNYVDIYVIKDSDAAVRFVLGAFFLYQIFSILENWSSENNNKIAKILQVIMVNKAERHFNVPEGSIGDIVFNDKSKEDEAN